jgi:hypothetical protein
MICASSQVIDLSTVETRFRWLILSSFNLPWRRVVGGVDLPFESECQGLLYEGVSTFLQGRIPAVSLGLLSRVVKHCLLPVYSMRETGDWWRTMRSSALWDVRSRPLRYLANFLNFYILVFNIENNIYLIVFILKYWEKQRDMLGARRTTRSQQ